MTTPFTAPIGGDYQPVSDTKLHPAVCTAFVFLGTQVSQFGESKKCWLQFELQDETREFDGKPYKVKIGEMFTFSVNAKSNLRKFLESWFGMKLTDDQASKIDFTKLPGRPAFILTKNTDKGGKTYVNVQSIKPYVAGPHEPQLQPLTATQAPVMFLMTRNELIPDSLPKWVKEQIASSPEFLETTGPDTPADSYSQPHGENPDLPF